MQLCLEEIRDNVRNMRKLNGWKREKEQYFEDRGAEVKKLTKSGDRGKV